MTIPLFIGGIGGPELMLVFLLVILLFGADKLPKLARASGEAMGEFQKGREEVEQELRQVREQAVHGTSTTTTTETAPAATAEAVEAETVEKESETDATPA
jgi:sec-independent protein translocase protein TatA